MNPFQGTPPPEVLLARAPLDAVFCQVRFPTILSIGKDDYVASFQEALRKDYPRAEPLTIQTFPFQIPGLELPTGGPTVKHHRFSTADRRWRLNLAPDFISLDTPKYTSRTEFLERLEQAFDVLATHIRPSHWNRLGVRYVDRIRGADLAEVNSFFQPELLGLLGVDAGGNHLKQALSEVLAEVAEGTLAVRWGLLPPQRTPDPIGIPAEPTSSWILDLDAFQERFDTMEPFDPVDLVARVRALSDRIYTFFRWAVQPAFLQKYGG